MSITIITTLGILILLPILITLTFSSGNETGPALPLAGKAARFINIIVDSFAILVLWIALLNIVALFLPNDTSYEGKNRMSVISSLALLFSYLAYYLLLEYMFQITLGKLLTRTKVVSDNGEKPRMEQVVYRTFARAIPFEFLSFIFTKEGLHDKLSSTVVVKKM